MNRTDQRGLSIVAVLLVLAIVAMALFFALNILASHKARTAQHGWDNSLGTWDEVMGRFPATEANGVAIELEQLAAALGVAVAPRAYIERALPGEEAKHAFAQLKKDVFHGYSVDQIQRRRRGAIDPPPQVLVDYIRTYDKELEDFRRLLLTGETPIWESDLSKLAAAPIPNLLGQIDLHKLLNSVALARIHSGDPDGAMEQVEASFNLARSLRDSPILINQLIYIAATRLQVAALRHIRDLPDHWIDRLGEHDPRESFVTAMKYEGWIWMHYDDVWAAGEVPTWKALASPILRPYSKLCMADASDDWRERIVNLAQVDALCDYDLSSRDADMNIPVPRWNKISEIMVPNLAGAVHRVARLEVDLELLRISVEADAARRADGVWPTPDGGRQSSAVCPDDLWVYEPTGEGIDIFMSRELQWPNQKGPILPQGIVLD